MNTREKKKSARKVIVVLYEHDKSLLVLWNIGTYHRLEKRIVQSS